MITIDRSNIITFPLGIWAHVTASNLTAATSYWWGGYYSGGTLTSNTQGNAGHTWVAAPSSGLITMAHFNYFVGGTLSTDATSKATVYIENNTTGILYGVADAGPWNASTGTAFTYSLSAPVVVNRGDRLNARITAPSSWSGGTAPTSNRYMMIPYLTVTV